MIDTQNSPIGGLRTSQYERPRTRGVQIDALSAHGVTKENLFCDKLLGARRTGPGLWPVWRRSSAATHSSFGDWIGWAGPCGTWST